MVAASFSLVTEGVNFKDVEFGILSIIHKLGENVCISHHSTFDFILTADPSWHSLCRTLFGYVFGMLFIVVTKRLLDRFEDLSLEHVQGANAQKMVLIIFVMTLHSLTEGVGIGVSFGGQSGMKLGHFISLSLAMHNVPEGLAVALVMTSRKVGTLRTGEASRIALFCMVGCRMLCPIRYVHVHFDHLSCSDTHSCSIQSSGPSSRLCPSHSSPCPRTCSWSASPLCCPRGWASRRAP